MEIKIEKGQKEGMAKWEVKGDTAGKMTFSVASDELIVINHTEIEEKYRGESHARDLLDALVEKARKDGFKILPICPFVRNEFEKDRTLDDVLNVNRGKN
ncbi:MAG TPA: GNAT family N-acetyltransferase [Cryomorphaceae bacterium]|nr:GNAT family N-acetyltransferase [Cryomorphaceae bacterium]